MSIVVLLLVFVEGVVGYKLNLGGCVVYFEEPCSPKDVRFYLYRGRDHSELNPFQPRLPLDFNVNVPTKILVHGYGGLNLDFVVRNLTLAYRELDYNIIVVDWSLLSALPCYPLAYLNTWHVGQCTAILSMSLAKLGLSPLTVHVLGFSLGAHVAGFASKYLQKTLSTPYGRITGLDPALPFFATLNNDLKLDKSDSPFVDVIHTSAGSFGKIEAIGHVDFYVNGGTMQPDCVNAKYPMLCSHMLVGKYFANTIQGLKYSGFPCPSILHFNFDLCDRKSSYEIRMGEYADRRSRGTYFVNIPSAFLQSQPHRKYTYPRVCPNNAYYNLFELI